MCIEREIPYTPPLCAHSALFIHIYTHTHIYIYIEREREREEGGGDGEIERERFLTRRPSVPAAPFSYIYMYTHTCVYMCIYICIYTHTYIHTYIGFTRERFFTRPFSVRSAPCRRTSCGARLVHIYTHI